DRISVILSCTRSGFHAGLRGRFLGMYRGKRFGLRFLRGLYYFEREQSYDEYNNHQDSLRSWLLRSIIVHEVANTQNRRSEVWDRDRELVNSDKLGGGHSAVWIVGPWIPRTRDVPTVIRRVGVSPCHKEVSTRT